MDIIEIQDRLTEIRIRLIALESAITNRDRTLDDISDGASAILFDVIKAIERISKDIG